MASLRLGCDGFQTVPNTKAHSREHVTNQLHWGEDNPVDRMKLTPGQHEDVGDVFEKLSKSWDFLAGEKRVFEFASVPLAKLQGGDFGYVLPITMADDGRIGGVGIVVTRPDAQKIGVHMFGLGVHDLSESDLRDACSEACNIFSDCVAMLISDNTSVGIGLPQAVACDTFAAILERSSVMATFQSASQSAVLSVVVFEVLRT